MLTLQDCIELSELREDEILAIAEHEHIPELAALEMGHYLAQTPDGERCIRAMIREDIAAARESGHLKHAAELRRALRHFVETHPGTQAAK